MDDNKVIVALLYSNVISLYIQTRYMLKIIRKVYNLLYKLREKKNFLLQKVIDNSLQSCSARKFFIAILVIM